MGGWVGGSVSGWVVRGESKRQVCVCARQVLVWVGVCVVMGDVWWWWWWSSKRTELSYIQLSSSVLLFVVLHSMT